MLEAGADIATRDDDGEPLLHLAAKRDRPATVVLLLEAGAALTARDNSGRTALHAAASSTEPGIPVPAAGAIVALLEAGADPNALDDSGLTAKQLVPPDSRAMITALFNAHAGRTVGNANASDGFGYTALHAAARANSPSLIAALVEAGADVDALDNDGHTPLLLAVGASRSRGRNAPSATFNIAAIMELVAAGADLELRDRYDRTALLLAVRWGEVAAIEVLVEAGADLKARNVNGNTALQLALYGGQTAAITVLAEAEAGP